MSAARTDRGTAFDRDDSVSVSDDPVSDDSVSVSDDPASLSDVPRCVSQF